MHAVTVSAEAPTAPALRVVLCDDVEPLRALARFVLEEDGGIEVVGEAGDAQSAIDLCADVAPDAVLLDLSMPGMDGLEAIPRLRRVTPGVTVVVFSGFAAERMAQAALDQGAARYLEKGAELSEVREALLEATGRAA